MSRAPAITLNARRTKHSIQPIESCIMLMTIAIILIVLWLLGMVSATTMGGFVHVLLVVAIVMLLIRVIQGRRIL